MASRKKLLPVLLPAALFFILLYLLVQLYRRNDTSTEFEGNPVNEGWYADPEMTILEKE